jgi:hypothetical protein
LIAPVQDASSFIADDRNASAALALGLARDPSDLQRCQNSTPPSRDGTPFGRFGRLKASGVYSSRNRKSSQASQATQESPRYDPSQYGNPSSGNSRY